MSTDAGTTATAPAPARPGRQRSEECDHLILDATLAVLGELGYAGLTVAAVLERSGVSSATLYRRWATKQELILAAVGTLIPQPVGADTGTLEGDLDAFVQHVAAATLSRREDVAEALNAEKKRNPELSAVLRERFLAPRLTDLRAILQRAKARGEVTSAPSPDVLLSLVVGPIHHRSQVLGQPLTPSFLRTVSGHAARALTS